VNLRVGGIFIRDTDLFQRDISALLNSDIGPLYKQIQHLLVLFPVYFKEIGAEGELRTVTTRMDTISGRRDTLIHFLRKQIHVESNNTHIELTRRIILFWHSLDPVVLSGVVPENVVSAIEPEGEWVRIPCEILRKVCKRNRISISELLEMDSGEAARRISRLRDFPAEHLERVVLILRLHTLLEEKYSFDSDDILRPLLPCSSPPRRSGSSSGPFPPGMTTSWSRSSSGSCAS
jgi:pyruvate,orthophosphate dikinase